MELTELAVLDYISRPPSRFVRPQCHLTFEAGAGGASPDFVVLDFEDNTVYVVEVSVAWDLTDLVDRVLKRQSVWYTALQEYGRTHNVSPLCWSNYRTAAFVRSDRYSHMLKKVEEHVDVSVISLDRVLLEWEWEWKAGNSAINSLNTHQGPRRAA